jgi:protein-disulfide isomerase
MRILYCAAFAAAICFAQPPSGPAPKGEPVASIAGQPILEDELGPLVEAQLRQLQYQEYEVRRKALDDLISRKLLAARAKEKGCSTEELLRREVDDKLPEPGDAEIQAFYFSQRNLSNVPFEDARKELVAVLKQHKAEQARRGYIDNLRQSADVVVMLPQPRVQISYDPARSLGNPDAPVTIVEFADFECPYCRMAAGTVQQLLNKYGDRVRFTFRDFPLREIHFHSRSESAAEAARCATEQGKFREYHDALFASSPRLGDDDLREQARAVGLNMTRFSSCLREGRFKAQVEADLKMGLQAGVTGTPAFFVNGVFLNGSQPLSVFESTIDAELKSIKTPGN